MINDPVAMVQELLNLPEETEWVEFKEAKNNFDFNDLGKYFSALSNEANLKGQLAGWLVFGVSDRRPRQVVGSNYRLQKPGLEKLKREISKHTNHQTTFINIHEFSINDRRVVLFQIPPAVRGVPTTWQGVAYGRIHDSLGPLSLQKIEQIRRQAVEDWSAGICQGATINDLDPQAVALARQNFSKKHPALAREVGQWDDTTFLNKAKVCISGGITRAAIILLGKNEAEHFLTPAIARITWLLRDAENIDKDYTHFGPPLLLVANHVFSKIRNLIYRHLPNGQLFPIEISQYDSWVIRESLHNCIAHQDYLMSGRINVVEEPDSLLFTNLGDFLPGSIEEVIRRDAPPEFYRNRFLAEAMVNLNMIDTIGSGIKRMFTMQRQRNFPMPDYDLSESGRVKVRIIGKVIDERYTRMLMQRTDLGLWEVIALDKVQKGKPIAENEFKLLKTKRLIEGRRPNLFVSVEVAAATETKADYIRKRAFDKQHYKKMVEDYLRQFHVATRADFDKLLVKKLSEVLNSEQKKNFVTNLLQEMRREGIIRPVGGKRGKGSRWELYKTISKDPV
ncbi:MAG: putative DNA binding domain-containing protein [Syntrophaceae bacterium]|nr:putative DNA binding domain-containing protein [Syntrophaceae bacterium]